MSNGTRVFFTSVVVLGIWSHARITPEKQAAAEAATHIGVFTHPVAFIAEPGVTFSSINVRSGPGAEYRVRREIVRGTRVIGIARRLDASGATWIELSNDLGYAKESVLSREAR